MHMGGARGGRQLDAADVGGGGSHGAGGVRGDRRRRVTRRLWPASLASIGHEVLMRRREVIAGLGAAAAWPLAARAQDDRGRAIGILMPYAESDAELEVRVAAFKQELGKRGWIDGKNLRFHERWATDDLERLRAHAAELVGLRPDVIIVTGRRVLPVIQQATRSIPTVFVWVTEPLGQGITSLARPGGNITGFARALRFRQAAGN